MQSLLERLEKNKKMAAEEKAIVVDVSDIMMLRDDTGWPKKVGLF